VSQTSLRTLLLAGFAAVVLAVPAAAAPKKKAAPPPPLPLEATAALLRDRAMAGASPALDFVRDMTTEIGPRPAGSPAEEAAAHWSAARLKALGFENVKVESFPVVGWVRGPERAEIVTASGLRQPLGAVALGESPPTPAEGIEAEIVVFDSLEALQAAPDGSLAGKIAVVNRKMVRMQDGSGYGPISRIRGAGPAEAAKKGAVAFMLRSAGTDNDRMAHTGTTRFVDGKVPVPAFALSIPDADQLARLAARGPVKVSLFSGASYVQSRTFNVIGEIRGREKPEEVVLIGGHLDSWDLGTGAVDDASGLAITMGAAKLIGDLPRKPRRTVRVVFFGAEEVAQPSGSGATGGTGYVANRKDEMGLHVVAGESDFGADRIYSLNLPRGSVGTDFARIVDRVMAPIGVLVTAEPALHGGTDIGPTVAAGSPVFELNQDGTRYFDLHHTANDTFDKIDPAQLNQNVAAWAALVWLIADSDIDFRKLAGAAAAPAH
jgi:Zn-dependent M28 family amino/carboxypeptidase